MTADDAPALRFETLGPLRVRVGDRMLTLGPPLQRALLAALLVDGGRTVQVPVLLDRLWEDDPPDTAVKSIQKYVSNLRQVLGVDRIVSDGGYRLAVDPDEVDSLRFERALTGLGSGRRDPDQRLATLEGALDLWRGDPYADLPGQLFLEPIRARLREVHQSMMEERLSLLLELGRVDQVASESRELVDLNPLRERLWQIRMTALAGAGRQAEALAEFRRLRTLLGEELGLEPSVETVELEERILLQDPALVSGPQTQGNLPARSASFVARSTEIERLEALLDSTRLVSLVGTAGIGKTTLALEVARRAAGGFTHGAWFVGFGPITEPGRVAGRMGESLGVIESEGRSVTEALTELLAKRTALIVLDNCEHVVDGVAELVSHLLRRAPGITVIATSRQPLSISGETIFDLAGLDYPPEGSSATAALRSPAVQLLTARANEAGARLAPLKDIYEPLAEICRRLDGVPLALELAAARLRFMSPAELSDQLTTQISALVSDRRDLPKRQRTLEAAIDWSFRLLEDDEKSLLTRLSVFRGGFTPNAVHQVCGWGLHDATAALEALVGHSLVTVVPEQNAGHRYQLLWVIRLFAESRIGEEVSDARQRHANYYLQLVEPQDPTPLHAPTRDITELLAEYENIRTAMTFFGESGDNLAGLRMASALGSFWVRTGALSEAQSWLFRFLANAPQASPELKVRGLMALADAYDPTSSELALSTAQTALTEAKKSGDPLLVAASSMLVGRTHALRFERETGQPLIEAALEIFEAAGDKRGMAQCYEALGVVHRGSTEDIGHYRRAIDLYRSVDAKVDLAQTLFSMAFRSLIPNGSFEEAHAAIEESAALSKDVGSPQIYVHALTGLGQLARLEGRLGEASGLLAEALEGLREFGDRRCTVRMLTALSRIDLLKGELDRAWVRLSEAARVGVELDQGLSSDTHELVDALGLLALAREDTQTAARWLGAAEAIRKSQGLLRPPPDQVVIDNALRVLEGELGPERLGRLLAEGSALSLEDLAASVMRLGRPAG